MVRNASPHNLKIIGGRVRVSNEKFFVVWPQVNFQAPGLFILNSQMPVHISH
jgi:hypothetical protein